PSRTRLDPARRVESAPRNAISGLGVPDAVSAAAIRIPHSIEIAVLEHAGPGDGVLICRAEPERDDARSLPVNAVARVRVFDVVEMPGRPLPHLPPDTGEVPHPPERTFDQHAGARREKRI